MSISPAALARYYDQSIPPSLLEGDDDWPGGLDGDVVPEVTERATASPGDIFGEAPTILAQDGTNAAKLTGLGFTADPTSAWTVGQAILIGDFEFRWSGSAWAASPLKSAAKPGDAFVAEVTVTASDGTNAAKLAGLGFVASPLTAWTTGQKIDVGAYAFNWSGSAWAAGAHA